MTTTTLPYPTTTTLSDYPFKGVVVCASGSWSDFDNAVCAVQSDMNYNRGNVLSKVKASDIENVLNTYRNLINADSRLQQFTAEPKNQDEKEAVQELLTILAQRTGKQFDFVREVMQTLYWGTKHSRVRSADILYPRGKASYEPDRSPTGSGGVSEWMGNLVTYGVPLVLIAGAVILGVKVYTTIQVAKRL